MSEKLETLKKVKGQVGQKFTFVTGVAEFNSESLPAGTLIFKPFMGTVPYQALIVHKSAIDNKIVQVEVGKIYTILAIQQEDYVKENGELRQSFEITVVQEIKERLTFKELTEAEVKIVNVLPVGSKVVVEEPTMNVDKN